MPDSTEVAQLSHILEIEGSEPTNGNINATVAKITVQTLSLIHAWQHNGSTIISHSFDQWFEYCHWHQQRENSEKTLQTLCFVHAQQHSDRTRFESHQWQHQSNNSEINYTNFVFYPCPSSKVVAQLSQFPWIKGSNPATSSRKATKVKITVQTLSLIHAWQHNGSTIVSHSLHRVFKSHHWQQETESSEKLHKICLLSMPNSTVVAQLSHILEIKGSEPTNGNINATVVKITVQNLSISMPQQHSGSTIVSHSQGQVFESRY